MPRSDFSRGPRGPRIPRDEAYSQYSYRRPLGLRELLPALGVGIGAGLFAFYITRLLLQRTPLRIERSTEREAPSLKRTRA